MLSAEEETAAQYLRVCVCMCVYCICTAFITDCIWNAICHPDDHSRMDMARHMKPLHASCSRYVYNSSEFRSKLNNSKHALEKNDNNSNNIRMRPEAINTH